MDYQEESNLKIGVSGAGKNYLKMPWSIEDTIENLEELKEMMQQKLIMTNYHGRGEKDAEEIAFDFDRAIQALKENQEYKQIGTLEEVREAVEKQRAKKPIYKHYENAGEPPYIKIACPNGCRIQLHPVTDKHLAHEHDYCPKCGQYIDWSEEE